MKIPLSQMNSGQTGTIVEILGGIGLLRRLQNLGLIVGKEISKISGQFMGGPITVRLGNTEVAVGFGMAQKIVMEVNQE